ncbi:MAG: hypothetical protein E6560_11710 [Yersiniaceae bacterium]|nr:hypothetical protein [Yersiniaceae bacterium]
MEIHDVTTVSGETALMGFVAMPAVQRKKVGQQAIMAAATDQLKRLFGEKASTSQKRIFGSNSLSALSQKRTLAQGLMM